jgi:hypothetical protein
MANTEEVREFHNNADTDGGVGSIHHTLGPGRFQAAAGSHLHDGGDSAPLLDGQIITGSRSGGSALSSVIAALVALGASDATTT